MNTTEFEVAVREAGGIRDADPDYTSAVILRLGDRCLIENFAETVLKTRQGFWRQTVAYSVTAGQATYRLPRRALGGIIETAEIQYGSSGDFVPLVPVTPGRKYQRQTGARVHNYSLDGDDLTLRPTPTSTHTLRITYFLRPPTLQAAQATTAGYVTDVDTSARTVTMSANTTQVADPGPPLITAVGALASGTPVDIVRPSGRFELSLVDGSQTLSGLVLTFAAGTDLSRVAVGDRVRQAGYSDWPQLPLEQHQALADYTAAVIASNKGDHEKAKLLAGRASAAQNRMVSVSVPRAQAQSPALISRHSFLRQRTRRW